MVRQKSVLSLGVCVLVMAAVGFSMSSWGITQDKKPDAKRDLDLSRFMRKKLDACSEILEGLVTEDVGMVRKGAKTLSELSAAEKWQITTNVTYRQFSDDFQRSVKKLQDSAEKEKFDEAALKWIDVTMNCMECHKFVRGMRVADTAPAR